MSIAAVFSSLVLTAAACGSSDDASGRIVEQVGDDGELVRVCQGPDGEYLDQSACTEDKDDRGYVRGGLGAGWIYLRPGTAYRQGVPASAISATPVASGFRAPTGPDAGHVSARASDGGSVAKAGSSVSAKGGIGSGAGPSGSSSSS
jgi:hypothetical protein